MAKDNGLHPHDVRVIIVFAGLSLLFYLVAFGEVTRPLRLVDPAQRVCAPYQTPHGRAWSCKPASDVARWILGE